MISTSRVSYGTNLSPTVTSSRPSCVIANQARVAAISSVSNGMR